VKGQQRYVDLSELYLTILNGDTKGTLALTREALAGGADPLDLVRPLHDAGHGEVGRLFECEEYFVPELMRSAQAMKARWS